MKKLVSKLLGCLIAFAPVSSFNSNNYSHADIFGNSERTRGVQVMTEKEFKKACAYINETINDYIDRYLDSPMGRKLGYKIFDYLEERASNVDAAGIPSSFRRKYFDKVRINCEESDLCQNHVFNTNLPSFVCRHWVTYFDKNYFSRMNRKYTILKYKKTESAGHILFLLCYYPKETPTKEKWVVLDPTAQFGYLRTLKEIKARNEKHMVKLSGEKINGQVKDLYSAVLKTYYMPNPELADKWIEHNGFLGIPLEWYYVFGRYMEPEAYSEIFWTRDQLGYNMHRLEKLGDRKNSFDNFLKYIYSNDELNDLHDLRKQAERNNSFAGLLYDLLCGYVSEKCEGIKGNIVDKYEGIKGNIVDKYEGIKGNIVDKYERIKENVVEKWDKITDKMCLIDLPSDIELSDDDCMGFGS